MTSTSSCNFHLRFFFKTLARYLHLQASSFCKNWLKSFVNIETKISEFANSVDLKEVAHNEQAHNEPPHLDLHCLPSSL